ncbi:hypothetical protein BC628DRAFT_1352838 [Trametes gibbosa]|nr:hypothetical protein BC628DRAFT_1352838 [Trametes gibbosa]
MALPRRPPPPLFACSPRALLGTQSTPIIDGVLKQLKACSRRLQAALACHRTELQVLERLYYKGKNQHRAALFWQRVAEMRKFGGRVDEMHMDDVVESLRLAFWGDPPSRTAKLLKGPWTHCPDAQALLFVTERIAACCMLLDRALERLLRAYESFTLMMQTGAFLQLVLVLAAIASRMSVLFTEAKAALEVAWSASYRALQTLHPASAARVKHLARTDTAAASPPATTPSRSDSKPPPAVDRDPGPGNVQDEDLGSTLVRLPPAQRIPAAEQNVDAFDADANANTTAHSHPREERVPPQSGPMTFSLLDELVRPIGHRFEATLASEGTVGVPAASAPKRKKAGGEKDKPAKRKKKKLDEIDAIFGF